MSDNISLKTAMQICDVLGKFAEVRSGPKPNKDFIMMVRKVDGRETLQLTQISQMNWLHRLIRRFGCSCLGRLLGNDATLKGVSNHLNRNSPYLPRRFVDLQAAWMPDILRGHYHKEAIPDVTALKKERLKQMREDRFRGIEIFKQCLAHHNARSRCKLYFAAQDGEKIDLRGQWRGGGGIIRRGPNPMGLLPHEKDMGQMAKKYEAPVLEFREFGYLEPHTFRIIKHPEDLNVAGFCYEYGLGVKRDLEKAFSCYKASVQSEPSYAAFYNLGRHNLLKKEWEEGKRVLNLAETALKNLMQEGNRVLDMVAQRQIKHPRPDGWDEGIIRATRSDMKICEKALSKTFQVQMELHQQCGDLAQLEVVRHRLNALKA